MKHIISFSGGKDSTALLLLMIENSIPFDEVVFCDTGLEYPEVYDHIKLVEKQLNLTVTKLASNKSFEYWLKIHKKTKGLNKDRLGYGWPDHRVRWCTTLLKSRVMQKYLRSCNLAINEVVEYHGITIDEIQRTKKNNDGRRIEYPLCSYNLTQADTLDFCYDRGFHWNGFYKFHKRANCYCCPLQSLEELYFLYTHYPNLWQDLKTLDIGVWRKFRKDYSISDLEEKFNARHY